MTQTTIEDFRIDIAHEQSFKYLQAKQFDHNSRVRRLIITDNNIPITFTGRELIMLSLYINGDNYSNTTCLFRDDGYPYVTFTESMLSREGDISCEIRIYDSEQSTVSTTFTFTMTVSRSLMNQDRIVTSSEFNVLNDLVLQANMIPDLVQEFKLSLEETKALIEQVRGNIAVYAAEFSDMKTQFTNDFNALLLQINTDINSYQEDYHSLKSDMVTLQSEITSWYTAAQAAENTRNSNEEKRQSDTQSAIASCEEAVTNTNAAAEDALNATTDAIAAAQEAFSKASYAKEQGDLVAAAIDGLEMALIDVNGGDAFTGSADYNDDFDGGNA